MLIYIFFNKYMWINTSNNNIFSWNNKVQDAFFPLC